MRPLVHGGPDHPLEAGMNDLLMTQSKQANRLGGEKNGKEKRSAGRFKTLAEGFLSKVGWDSFSVVLGTSTQKARPYFEKKQQDFILKKNGVPK